VLGSDKGRWAFASKPCVCKRLPKGGEHNSVVRALTSQKLAEYFV
jgi:hypothetical protein